MTQTTQIQAMSSDIAAKLTEELLSIIEGSGDVLRRTISRSGQYYEDHDLLMIFSAVAEKMIGRPFTIDANQHKVIVALMKWLLGEPKPKLDLKKGICLIGPVGCGKTTVIEVLSQISYAMGYEYELQGQRSAFHWPTTPSYEIIDALIHGARLKEFANQPILFIDSLGTEPKSVNYCGTTFSPIRQLMSMRCSRKDQMTFITMRDTDAVEMLNNYGEDASSLLHGLCNVLHYSGPDYRQIKTE